MAQGLKSLGCDARAVEPPFPSLPYALETLCSIPYYLVLAAWKRPGLAVGVKPFPNIWLTLGLLKILGTTCILDVDDKDGAYRPGLAGKLAALSQAPAFHLGLDFSTHHPGLESWLKERARGGRVFRLGQGVDLGAFDGRMVKAGHPQLFFTAHLNVACEFPLLLEWVGPLLKRDPELRLVVAGGGPRLAEFQALCRRAGLAKQVRFTGWLSPSSVGKEMASADVCLAPYGRSEANRFRVPMKVGEYLAMGKPVVTNLIPGIAGLAAFVHDGGRDAASARKVIADLLRGRGDGREKKGQAFVRRNLGWTRVMRRFAAQGGWTC